MLSRRRGCDEEGGTPRWSRDSFADGISTPHKRTWNIDRTVSGLGGGLGSLGNPSLHPAAMTSFPRPDNTEAQVLEEDEVH